MAGARMGGALRQIEHLFVEGTAAGLSDEQLLERFLTQGDESAFAALVERHGPMVLGVCRSVLRHLPDVEDAFQATFLILVCKGRSIRGRGALAIWLRQVAHRVAVRAGVEETRRRAHERRAGDARPSDLHQTEPEDDWRLALHEELARLSDKYRLPLLLCDLEGKTHAQAAAELGCGPATIQRRLSGARALLRSRLIRRGIALSAGALTANLVRPACAAVPPAWVEAAVAGGRPFASRAARLAIGQVVATSAEVLARHCLKRMALGRLRAAVILSVTLTALGGIAWGVGAAGLDEPKAVRPGPSPTPGQPRSMMSAGTEKPAARRDATVPEQVAFHGRVVDPRGRPVAGATLYVAGRGLEPSACRTVRATSGADGRFRFEVPAKEFRVEPGGPLWQDVNVVARAPGYAFGLADDGEPAREATLTLARDDAPIIGRILDLEGRPVGGVSVKVMEVKLSADVSAEQRWVTAFKVFNTVRPATNPYTHLFKDAVDTKLDSWHKDLEDQKEYRTLDAPFLPNRADAEPMPAFIPDTTTGPDGRFRLGGIGRWRTATLQLDGPTIETTRFQVRSWPGAPIRLPDSTGSRRVDPLMVYGATFDHVAGPTRPIEGVVRDRETGRPLAGIIVYARRHRTMQASIVRTISDSAGRYRLVGLPLGREGTLVAIPACDFRDNDISHRLLRHPQAGECPPYFEAEVPVGYRPGREPVPLDIALRRGVRVTGRIIDKKTGKPVRGRVDYFVFDDNPHYKANPNPDRLGDFHFTGGDGTFRLVAYPGPAVLAAIAYASPYVRGAGVEAIKARRPDWLAHLRRRIRFPAEFHALQWIEPPPGVSSATQNLLVESAHRPPG